MYQRITLATLALIGAPGPLPPELVGLADESLADISAAISPSPVAYAGAGFWPVTVTTPTFDPQAETVTDEVKYLVANASKRTVTGRYGKRALTPEEFKERFPVPASVTNYQARAVMRQFFLPDGRSLLNAVNDDLVASREAAKALPETDPQRIQIDVAWQAWEQANSYDRDGNLVASLAAKYGMTDEQTDTLFREAQSVTA